MGRPRQARRLPVHAWPRAGYTGRPAQMGGPGGSSFLRGAHPCPPPQGQDSEWGGIASQPAELWVPPWLLRLRDQARVYPGIPGPKVTP